MLLHANGSALAASLECRQLEAQLERLPGAPGNLSEPGEIAAAAAGMQRDQIDLARIRAAELGCDRAISGDMIGVCAALNANIARMQDNLGELETPLPALPRAEARRERIRILDAMELAGCNDPDAEDQEAEATYGAPAEQAIRWHDHPRRQFGTPRRGLGLSATHRDRQGRAAKHG